MKPEHLGEHLDHGSTARDPGSQKFVIAVAVVAAIDAEMSRLRHLTQRIEKRTQASECMMKPRVSGELA